MTSTHRSNQTDPLTKRKNESGNYTAALKLHTTITEALAQTSKEETSEAIITARSILNDLKTAMRQWEETVNQNIRNESHVLADIVATRSGDNRNYNERITQDADKALLNACKTSLYTHARKLLHATDFISQICAAINEFMTDCGLRPIFTIKKSEIALSDETIEQEIAALRSPRA